MNFTNVEKTAAQIDALVAGGGGSFPLSAAPPAAMRAGSGLELDSTFDAWGAWDGSLVAETTVELSAASKTGADQAAVMRPIKMFDRGGLITLGEKSVGESLNPVMRPIKSFARDEATVGAERLIDAMTIFGVERNVGGGIHDDRSHGDALDLLAAHHPTRAQVARTAIHSLLD